MISVEVVPLRGRSFIMFLREVERWPDARRAVGEWDLRHQLCYQGSQVNNHGSINFAKSEFLKKCVFPGLKCINCRMNLKQQYDLLYYCHIRCQGLFRRYLKKRSFCCVNVQYFELHWDFYACCQMQVDVLFLPWWVFCIEETINCQLSTINYIAALLSPRLFRNYQLSTFLSVPP